MERRSEWQWESEADRGEEGHSVRRSNKYEGLRHTFHIICASFSVSVGRILIEMHVCFFSMACTCPQVSECCVCMFVCGSLQVFLMRVCACVCVCVCVFGCVSVSPSNQHTSLCVEPTEAVL